MQMFHVKSQHKASCISLWSQNAQRVGSGQAVRTDVRVRTTVSVTDRRVDVFVSRAGQESAVRTVRSSELCVTYTKGYWLFLEMQRFNMSHICRKYVSRT